MLFVCMAFHLEGRKKNVNVNLLNKLPKGNTTLLILIDIYTHTPTTNNKKHIYTISERKDSWKHFFFVVVVVQVETKTKKQNS